MQKIYVFLATGFEDIEAIAVVDILRRAALPVRTVSVTSQPTVLSSHHVPVVADDIFEETDFSDAAMLFLPGGLPGATNLEAHDGLAQLIMDHHAAGLPLAAICAAPMVYGRLGILNGHKATCYPGFEDDLLGATPTGALVVQDGQFFLGKGPAAAYELGYAIVAHFCGKEKADEIAAGMLYPEVKQ